MMPSVKTTDDLSLRPVESSQLTHRIRISLLDWIRNASNGSDEIFKLPKEDELAGILGVSRTALRDVLEVMEYEGYITRRKGVGTLVNPVIARCRTRIDLQTEVSGIIESQGYKASFELLDTRIVPGHRKAFPMSENSFLNVEKVFYADLLPAVFANDRLAGSLIPRNGNGISELDRINFFLFLKKYVKKPDGAVAYVFADVKAILPDEKLQKVFKLEKVEPILYLHNLSYNVDHRVILDSDIYFRSDVLGLNLLRHII